MALRPSNSRCDVLPTPHHSYESCAHTPPQALVTSQLVTRCRMLQSAALQHGRCRDVDGRLLQDDSAGSGAGSLPSSLLSRCSAGSSAPERTRAAQRRALLTIIRASRAANGTLLLTRQVFVLEPKDPLLLGGNNDLQINTPSSALPVAADVRRRRHVVRHRRRQ
jgi:hypothetical protein